MGRTIVPLIQRMWGLRCACVFAMGAEPLTCSLGICRSATGLSPRWRADCTNALLKNEWSSNSENRPIARRHSFKL